MASIDNLIAFKILYMLVTPFDKTDAYNLGIIDENGKSLKKVRELKTSQERNAYTALHRLVFNLKRLIARAPGGKSTLVSLIAAYWLIKENESSRYNVKEEDLINTIDLIESKNICLVEEEIQIASFLKKFEEEGGVIANVVGDGAATSVDYPTIKPKKKKTLKLFRRQKDGEYEKV